MTTIESYEIAAFEKLFCFSAGYVLDFSTSAFDSFTRKSIGIALCGKYNLSKWKSLDSFLCDETTTDANAAKLLGDLLEYYEIKFIDTGNYNKILYEKCKNIVDRLSNKSSITSIQVEKIREQFDSDYINKQIEQMNKSITTNPDDAIGKAKDLLESCYKTILKESNVTINNKWDIIQLNKETCKILKLTPNNISDTAKASQTIKGILGNFSCIAQGIAELRNHYGTGHGKDAKYKGLSSRHAFLAVGSVVTVVNFLWDTHLEQKQRK